MAMLTAATMDRDTAGDNQARQLLRILTPLIKLRACRDNIRVATGAMEVRGGNGYIEEWVNARLVRDAHIGVLWEGTSNINAIDAVRRAVGRSGADEALESFASSRLEVAGSVPEALRKRIGAALQKAFALARDVARTPEREHHARIAATALYNAVSAVILAHEGTRPSLDARRLVVARFVLEHRLETADPLSPRDDTWELAATAALLSSQPLSLAEAQRIVSA
jgi:hypothetical protein